MSTSPRPPQIIPYLFDREVPAALDFLCRAFGFKEEMRTGTPSGGMHGEASLQGQLVMMGQGPTSAVSGRRVMPAQRRWAFSSTSTTSTDITKSRRRRARRSCIRRRTSLWPKLLSGRSRGPSLLLHLPSEGGLSVLRFASPSDADMGLSIEPCAPLELNRLRPAYFREPVFSCVGSHSPGEGSALHHLLILEDRALVRRWRVGHAHRDVAQPWL